MREYYILPADCLAALKKLPENSVDSMVTDPPAGISFMGKDWDSAQAFKINMILIFSEAIRILKPGAYALVWAIPRTSHWTATALEDSGFEIRDVITHLFGSGFPKSLDISKAIDKAARVEREVIGYQDYSAPDIRGNSYDQEHVSERERLGVPITQPATAESKLWQGFGTALKPASEHWILCRKPLSEKTVAANVLKHGTGGINIDGCRVTVSADDPNHRSIENKTTLGSTFGSKDEIKSVSTGKSQLGAKGRFPANLVLSHNEDCVEVGTRQVGSGNKKEANERTRQGFRHGTQGESLISGSSNAPDHYGTETVPEFHCTPGCAVAMLDEQSGIIKGEIGRPGRKAAGNYSASSYKVGVVTQTGIKDIGGASRFFYCAKASKSERNLGCEGLEEKDAPKFDGGDFVRGEGNNAKDQKSRNHHPTVKPIRLMRYLCRLITPPNGIILDPFMGSGSTGIAALSEGFSFIGIEREQEYFKIALSRLRYTYFGDHSLWLKDLKREGVIFNPELLLILREEDEYPKT